MLRIGQSKSAVAAKKYFDQGFARGDYFMGYDAVVGRQVGTWGGRAAVILGLDGDVRETAFEALCDNRRPDGSGPVTPRTKADRRVGFGLTVDVPKSDSITMAMTEDPSLLQTFQTALSEMMPLIELEARTRVRVGGRNELRVTGNLAWATFIHGTTRPIDGYPDPHVHAHVFIFNMTFDAVEGRFKAADLSFIKKNAPYYESVFSARLAELVQQAGYGIRQVRKSWEMAAVPDEVIRKFSRRTQEIEAEAKKRGITDPKQKAELGAKTRRRKSETLPPADVRAEWNRRLTDEERKAIHEAKSASRPQQPEIDLGALIAQALENCLKYRTLTTDKQLLDEALRLGMGRVEVESLREALEHAGTVGIEINGEQYLATPDSQQHARQILSVARDGRGQLPSFGPPADHGTESAAALNPMVRELLESQDRVTLLRGAGHRFLDKVERECADALLSRGHQIVFVMGDRLPADKSHGSRVGGGGRTVREFLDNRQLRDGVSGRTLWVRNPVTVPVRDLAELFRTAAQSQARVVLAAGRRRSVRPAPGDILGALEQLAGLRSAQRESARNARAERRRTFEDLKRAQPGRRASAFDRAWSAYHFTKDDDIHKAAGREFVKALRERKTPIVVSSGDLVDLTRAVRVAMRDAGQLKRGRRFEQLIRTPYNDEQRSDPQIYQRGQVVQFFKAAKGFKAGQKYEVLGRDVFGNVLARKGHFVEALPLSKSDRFGLFRKSSIELGRGDVVRITCTGRTINEGFGLEKFLSPRRQAVRLANFSLFGIKAPDRRYRVPRDSHHRIAGFTLDGSIKLDNGWILPADVGHLDYGYCVGGGQRAIGSFDRVLLVDVPSAMGKLPSLDGLVCERTPELRIITPDPERVRAEFREQARHQERSTEDREGWSERAWQRAGERQREAEYARQEYQYER